MYTLCILIWWRGGLRCGMLGTSRDLLTAVLGGEERCYGHCRARAVVLLVWGFYWLAFLL